MNDTPYDPYADNIIGWSARYGVASQPAPMPEDDDPGLYEGIGEDMGLSRQEWEDVERRETGHSLPASREARAAAGKNLLWSVLEPWDESAIPTRPWIARGYLMRGAVTVVSGPGSAGKSSLMVAWAACLALGCSFGSFRLSEPLKVATYNVEDDENEQKRRFSAMCGAMNVRPADFNGNLAILGPESVGTLLVATERGVMVNTPVMDSLKQFIHEFRPDVLMLDPFVELHSAEENDNTAIRAVVAAFRALATEVEGHSMSVVLLHHSKKGFGTPGDPDTLRGASAIVGAARVVLTLNVMTEQEANEADVPLPQRRSYFRLDGAKSNYAPVGDAEWFERQERQLLNGDAVAVAWPWKPAKLLQAFTAQQCNRALDMIDKGPGPDAEARYAATRRGRSNARWAGNPLMEEFGINDDQAAVIIGQWLESGLLVKMDFKDRAEGKMRQGVNVDGSKRPS